MTKTPSLILQRSNGAPIILDFPKEVDVMIHRFSENVLDFDLHSDIQIMKKAVDIILSLRRRGDGCWCVMSTGDPLYTQHSEKCSSIQEFIYLVESVESSKISK